MGCATAKNAKKRSFFPKNFGAGQRTAAFAPSAVRLLPATHRNIPHPSGLESSARFDDTLEDFFDMPHHGRWSQTGSEHFIPDEQPAFTGLDVG
jgi:hypothetical protein